MSNARERIQQALDATREWYTQPELQKTLRIASSDCSLAMKAMRAEGVVQAIKPPPGRAPGCHFIYAAIGVAPPEGAATLPAPLPAKLPRLPKKLTGFRAAARAKARADKPAKQRMSLAPRGARPDDIIAPTTPPRWALCSDGALILLDNGTEISKPAARALIAFVRTLDAGAA